MTRIATPPDYNPTTERFARTMGEAVPLYRGWGRAELAARVADLESQLADARAEASKWYKAAADGIESILFGPAAELAPVVAGVAGVRVVDAPLSIAKAADPGIGLARGGVDQSDMAAGPLDDHGQRQRRSEHAVLLHRRVADADPGGSPPWDDDDQGRYDVGPHDDHAL